MSPSLLLLSGMHGDEYEIIACVAAYIKKHKSRLPQYLFIPEVSPSAVAQKTRKNAFGHDINRSFVEPPTDPEVIRFMQQVVRRRFDLCIDFHEDPDLEDGFYLYDSGRFTGQSLQKIRATILSTGAKLYTGIDDTADPMLGLQITDGYISTPLQSQDEGFSLEWLVTRNVAKRVITVEIPGKAPLKLKDKLVEAIFNALVPLALNS